ncbi:MAG: lasso peptide biosynthesis B2 protein [Gemmatimonadota bacterium]
MRRLLALPRIERRLLLRAACALFLARRALHPVRRRTPSLLETRPVVSGRVAGVEPVAVALAVSRAGRYLPGEWTCLEQALAGRTLLAAFGRSSRVRLGAARSAPGGQRFHAWLECDGVVVLGGDQPRAYVPLDARP